MATREGQKTSETTTCQFDKRYHIHPSLSFSFSHCLVSLLNSSYMLLSIVLLHLYVCIMTLCVCVCVCYFPGMRIDLATQPDSKGVSSYTIWTLLINNLHTLRNTTRSGHLDSHTHSSETFRYRMGLRSVDTHFCTKVSPPKFRKYIN